MGSTWHLHRQSKYMFGRDRRAVDQTIDHPSCSKVHAVIQFRKKTSLNATGEMETQCYPYILDMNSANGTCINGDKIKPLHYYRLFEHDVIKFGFSSRDYVVLH